MLVIKSGTGLLTTTQLYNDTPPLGTSSCELGLEKAREATVGGRLLQIDNCIEIRIHSSKQMMPMGVQKIKTWIINNYLP